jgi:hypothetical protein
MHCHRAHGLRVHAQHFRAGELRYKIVKLYKISEATDISACTIAKADDY